MHFARMKLPEIAAIVSLVLATNSSGFPATYYVSNQGLDSNSGRSPERAWVTLDRVNRATLQPGDRVLFERDGVWRGQLVPRSGTSSGRITYGAYGDGPKPLLLGSVSKSHLAGWTSKGNQIWLAKGLPADVGNLIFGKDKACGVKVWQEGDLKQEGQFWYDKTRHLVKLFSTDNPARRYGRIECALNRNIIDENDKSHITFTDLALKYGGAHGIGGGNTHHITVRRCDLGFIGGADQYGDGRKVRFGNGIEFFAGAHDNVVEQCSLWEIYDAALTNQNDRPHTLQYNIIYRNNVIWNCEYSFECWNQPDSSDMHDIYFSRNTCVNAGHGWGHDQRPDPSGRHLCFYPSTPRMRNIAIRNNIFYGAVGQSILTVQWNMVQLGSLVMDHNCWYQPNGPMIAFQGITVYTMAEFTKYQTIEWKREPHSFCADPKFVDVAHQDYHLAETSPCIDMGDHEDIAHDFNGKTAPRGKDFDIGAYEFSQEQQ